MMEWRKASDDRFMMAGDLEHAKQHIHTTLQHSEIFKNKFAFSPRRYVGLQCNVGRLALGSAYYLDGITISNVAR